MKLGRIMMLALNLAIVASAVVAFTSGWKFGGP